VASIYSSFRIRFGVERLPTANPGATQRNWRENSHPRFGPDIVHISFTDLSYAGENNSHTHLSWVE